MDFQSSVSICEDKNPIVTKKKKKKKKGSLRIRRRLRVELVS